MAHKALSDVTLTFMLTLCSTVECTLREKEYSKSQIHIFFQSLWHDAEMFNYLEVTSPFKNLVTKINLIPIPSIMLTCMHMAHKLIQICWSWISWRTCIDPSVKMFVVLESALNWDSEGLHTCSASLINRWATHLFGPVSSSTEVRSDCGHIPTFALILINPCHVPHSSGQHQPQGPSCLLGFHHPDILALP